MEAKAVSAMRWRREAEVLAVEEAVPVKATTEEEGVAVELLKI